MVAATGCDRSTERADHESATLVSAAPPPPAPPPVEPVADPMVERGAYLAKAANCVLCHTAIGPRGPDMEHAFAGGLEVKEPFGTWRSPNITPDKATGIGAWTDDQIARAIREGIRPDGSHLAAIMPSTNFSVMTDSDVHALIAFLRSLKPVANRPARTGPEFKMPRPPRPAFAVPPDPNGEPLARGAYFATIMQCSHCHWMPDKRGDIAGPDKMFAGGLPMEFPPGDGVVYSRNLTSDAETGLGRWTEDQVFTAIKLMMQPSGQRLRGPMLMMQGGWGALDDRDVHAVAAFIKSLPPIKHKVHADEPPHTPAPTN